MKRHLPRLIGCVVLWASVCLGDTTVPQSGPDPVVLDQTAPTDNLTVLMAAASEHNSGLTQLHSGSAVYPKHFWFTNWNGSAGDHLKWRVSAAEGAPYRVFAKLDSKAAVPLRLSVEGSSSSLSFTTRPIGWDRLDAGVIRIPQGTSTLSLARTGADTSRISILSLELVRERDLAAYERRVAAFRSDTTWFSRAKYGVMFQAGPWAYPESGNRRKSLEQYARDFDVPRFVRMVKSTGAQYVIWSMTWWTYQICAPVEAVDRITGNGDRTSGRDLIGELAAALKAGNIRFMLYYHNGHDGHLGYDSTDWWRNQRFPAAEFTNRGTGDRSVFFDNWVRVVTEVGNRYGGNLDGWFFDDGLIYYPAPFERLGRAAKAGNPARLVCYNPWIAVRNTEFQDVAMGEGDHGEVVFGSAGAGGNGVFTDGRLKGLLQHGMFTMEQDWGVHAAGQPIKTSVTAGQAVNWVGSASRRCVPLTFNLMMRDDQTCSRESLDVLKTLKRAIHENHSHETNE